MGKIMRKYVSSKNQHNIEDKNVIFYSRISMHRIKNLLAHDIIVIGKDKLKMCKPHTNYKFLLLKNINWLMV